MSQRTSHLHAIADTQLAELIDVIGAADPATLRRLIPGREKLGDGTLGALAQHTADNYQRIADFALSGNGTQRHQPRDHAPHWIPSRLRLARRPLGSHVSSYTARTVDRDALRHQLTDTRTRLAGLRQLQDSRLDSVPPDGTFRFCDGRRTLEQVITALLNHQQHQLDAISAAVA